jgi:imidazolonepropionase-like amidohydrolase
MFLSLCRAVFALSLLCVVSPTQAMSSGAIVIRNVAIIDVQGNKLDVDRDVIVEGNRIVGVQAGGTARPPKDARVVDGSGKFLIPGLWDFHVHVFSAAGEEDIALPMYIINGVTGIRDAGAFRKLAEMRKITTAVERGERVGPRIILAGAMIDGPPGSWPDQMVASNAEEGRARVRESKAAGWGFVKSYSLLSEATYLAIASEAKRQRVPLYGHVPESVTLQTAIKAGHRSIEHFGRITQACSTAEAKMISANAEALRSGNPMASLMTVMAGHNKTTLEHWNEKLCQRVAREVASAGVAVMPSLMVSDFYVGKDPAPDDPRMQSVPKQVRAQWAQGDWRRQQMSPELLALAPKSIALDWKTFKLMHDSGVKMLAGTDAAYANPFIFHGYTLHDELERYVAAGLTPQQALMTATVNPGRFLMRKDLDGRVSYGRRADLVLLDANPLEDIRATRRINAVIANGRLFDRDALDKLLREAESKAARE